MLSDINYESLLLEGGDSNSSEDDKYQKPKINNSYNVKKKMQI